MQVGALDLYLDLQLLIVELVELAVLVVLSLSDESGGRLQYHSAEMRFDGHRLDREEGLRVTGGGIPTRFLARCLPSSLNGPNCSSSSLQPLCGHELLTHVRPSSLPL